MRRAALVVAIATAMVISIAGDAGATAREGGRIRAWMYLISLHGDDRIHLLERVCSRPQAETGCLPMKNGIRRAIREEFDGTLEFVHRRWPRSDSVHWVLGPIRIAGRLARFRYAWEAPDGCTAFGTSRFERIPGGGWESIGGPGGAGCP